MRSLPGWMRDEMVQIGTDYTSIEEVKNYDRRMRELRDIKAECDSIIKKLALKKNHNLLEIGTGTGEFAINAAGRCSMVYATDVSPVMLEYAGNKAKALGVHNLRFCLGGFLSYENEGILFDNVVSQLALHHLPDFWKYAALARISGMMKTGGRLFIRDLVFRPDSMDYHDYFNSELKKTKQRSGEQLARDIEKHIKNEFSTLDWIMEGMLEKAGFRIDTREYLDDFMAVYLCTKTG